MSKWEWKKLGEVCEIHGRIGWQGLTRKEYRSSGDYLLITGINFTDNNTVDYESCVYVDKERYVQDQYIQVRENDLLITKDGTLGKLALIAEMPPKPATLNGGLFVIRNPDNKIYPKFLMYVMKSEPFRKMIRKSITGSTVPHLTQNMLVNFPIPIPSLSEQRSIVKQLDEKLIKIEKIKTNAETNLKNAKELFESTLEKELNPGKNGELPSGWEWEKLGDLFKMVRGPFGGSLKKECFKKEGHPVYEQQNAIYSKFEFRYFIDDKKFEEMSRFRVEPGDFIMSCSGTMGKVAIVPPESPVGIINQALLKMSPQKGIISTYAKYYMMNSSFVDSLLKNAQGVAIKNVAAVKELKLIPFALPPLSVQKEIVARLDKLSENVKRLEANYKQIIADCDELKKSILKKTFEGES